MESRLDNHSEIAIGVNFQEHVRLLTSSGNCYGCEFRKFLTLTGEKLLVLVVRTLDTHMLSRE